MKKSIKFIAGVCGLVALCACGGGKDKEAQVPVGAATAKSFDVEGLGKVTPVVAYYDFRKEDMPLETFGISGAEGHGRWTDGDVSVVVVPCLPFSQYTLRINAVVPTNDAHKNAQFDVFINDSPVMSDVVLPDGQQTLYIDVRKEWLTAEGKAEIRFAHKNAYIINQVFPESADSRKINFGFTDITLYGYVVE